MEYKDKVFTKEELKGQEFTDSTANSIAANLLELILDSRLLRIARLERVISPELFLI